MHHTLTPKRAATDLTDWALASASSAAAAISSVSNATGRGAYDASARSICACRREPMSGLNKVIQHTAERPLTRTR
jgi:hypothetical protein